MSVFYVPSAQIEDWAKRVREGHWKDEYSATGPRGRGGQKLLGVHRATSVQPPLRQMLAELSIAGAPSRPRGSRVTR